jgi:hypothetical protein
MSAKHPKVQGPTSKVQGPESKIRRWTTWKRVREMQVNLSSRKEESQANLPPVGNALVSERFGSHLERSEPWSFQLRIAD